MIKNICYVLMGIGMVLFGLYVSSDCVDNLPFFVVAIGLVATLVWMMYREHYYYDEEE